MNEQIAARIALAVVQNGSGEHGYGPGATLTAMAEFAEEGCVQAMSHAIVAHCAVYPRDRDTLLKHLPLKVLNLYLYKYCEHSHTAIERWRNRTPNWETTLQDTVLDPARFVMVVSIISEEIRRAELD